MDYDAYVECLCKYFNIILLIDSDVTGSYANDRINGKISPIAGAQFEDNNTNDEVKTKLKHLLRAEANVDHWQSQMFKPNLEQHVTDHAIPDSFMRNSSKLKVIILNVIFLLCNDSLPTILYKLSFHGSIISVFTIKCYFKLFKVNRTRDF